MHNDAQERTQKPLTERTQLRQQRVRAKQLSSSEGIQGKANDKLSLQRETRAAGRKRYGPAPAMMIASTFQFSRSFYL